jgi:hypothetical protein
MSLCDRSHRLEVLLLQQKYTEKVVFYYNISLEFLFLKNDILFFWITEIVKLFIFAIVFFILYIFYQTMFFINAILTQDHDRNY